MKKIGTIISFVLVAGVLFCLFALLQEQRYGTWNTYRNRDPRDCDFALPSTMRIVYSDTEKRYAVEITQDVLGKKYLWARSRGWIDEAYDPYTTFSDSCKAKSFARQYLREKDEELLLHDSYK